MDKKTLIQHLNLEPHIEGGYFRRSYCSNSNTILESGERSLMSSIYYLLTDDSPIGFFHQNQSDIMHYWHAGESLTYWLIDPAGKLSTAVLGPNIEAGEQLQLLVPGGQWKATHLEAGEFGLLSEAVSPGFDYDDMALASSEQMQRDFPAHWPIIAKYCKP